MSTPDIEKEIKLYLKDELRLMANNFYRFMMGYKESFFTTNNLAHMKKAVINRMSEEHEDFQKFNSIDLKIEEIANKYPDILNDLLEITATYENLFHELCIQMFYYGYYVGKNI